VSAEFLKIRRMLNHIYSGHEVKSVSQLRHRQIVILNNPYTLRTRVVSRGS